MYTTDPDAVAASGRFALATVCSWICYAKRNPENGQFASDSVSKFPMFA